MEKLMFEAIDEESMEKLRDVLDQGADINGINEYGISALQMTVRWENPEMTQFLIDSGANVNEEMRAEFNAQLMYIICNPFLDIIVNSEHIIQRIKSLIIGGANVNLRGSFGEFKDSTILHVAAYYTDADLIKFLLNRGAIVDARNALGQTPLHDAAMNPFFVSKLKVLLEAGADPNAKDHHGYTPLLNLIVSYNIEDNYDYNTKVNNIVEAIKLFKKYNADFNAQNRRGYTITFYCYRRPLKIFQTFFDIGGVDVNGIVVHHNEDHHGDLEWSPYIRTCKGQTMLHILCLLRNSPYDNFKYLCKMGADINVLDTRNRSPLQYAITNLNGHKDLRKIKYLLKNKSRVDTIGGYNILNIRMITDEFVFPFNYSSIPEIIWKLLIEHLAKLNADGQLLDEMTMKTLKGNPAYLKYFETCTNELNHLKKTKLICTGVTFFNLLVDNKKKLIKHARNEAAVEEFKKTNLQKKFLIFGDSIDKRFNKAIIFIKSHVILSSCLPCNLNQSHLIIEKILSSFTSDDIKILCEKEPQGHPPPLAVPNQLFRPWQSSSYSTSGE